MSDNSAVHRSFLMLRNAPEFAPFREWLVDQQVKVGNDLVSANDDRTLHLAQGAARWIRFISGLIEGAPAVLDKERQG